MEEGAFLELVKDNERQILHVCRYYSAIDDALSVEDLFQEIVCHLWKSYPKYRKRNDCKISTWVYREIAEIMGMSASNVGNRIQRLKIKLKSTDCQKSCNKVKVPACKRDILNIKSIL